MELIAPILKLKRPMIIIWKNNFKIAVRMFNILEIFDNNKNIETNFWSSFYQNPLVC